MIHIRKVVRKKKKRFIFNWSFAKRNDSYSKGREKKKIYIQLDMCKKERIIFERSCEKERFLFNLTCVKKMILIQ